MSWCYWISSCRFAWPTSRSGWVINAWLFEKLEIHSSLTFWSLVAWRRWTMNCPFMSARNETRCHSPSVWWDWSTRSWSLTPVDYRSQLILNLSELHGVNGFPYDLSYTSYYHGWMPSNHWSSCWPPPSGTSWPGQCCPHLSMSRCSPVTV